MKNTKEIILRTALSLFNQLGLPRVTLRTIAAEMGISQGNLTYHYKKRDTIVEALYFQLVERIDRGMEQIDGQKTPLEQLFTILSRIMDSFYEYRFFLLDFVHIMRVNNTIRQHYPGLSRKREEQFKTIFSRLEDAGLMRGESLPGEYLFLYQRFQILADFWISSAEVARKTISKSTVREYSAIIAWELYPYLTEKGQEEFRRLLPGPDSVSRYSFSASSGSSSPRL